MLAAVRTRFGPPGVVRVVEVADPVAGPGQVRVAVAASTVTRTDCHYRSGRPLLMRAIAGVRRPKKGVLGCEYAGIVATVGEGVSALHEGDRVFGYLEGPFGGHAEQLIASATGPIATVPDGVELAVAAGATEGAHYAISSLDRAGLVAGQSLLVYGATGAIGSAAVQLGRARGAEVTAVCRPEHLDLVRGLRPDRLLATTSPELFERDRYDVVFDAVDHLSFFRCRRALRRDGTYVSTGGGAHHENVLLPWVSPLLPGPTVRFAFPRIDAAMVQYLAGLLASGEFRPLVDRTYPLAQIVEAYRYAQSGEKLGTVVLLVGGEPG